MLGTYGGALEARQIAASEGNLVAEVAGEVELEGKVLVVRRIHVKLRLRAPADKRETAERVAGIYADASTPAMRPSTSCVSGSIESEKPAPITGPPTIRPPIKLKPTIAVGVMTSFLYPAMMRATLASASFGATTDTTLSWNTSEVSSAGCSRDKTTRRRNSHRC